MRPCGKRAWWAGVRACGGCPWWVCVRDGWVCVWRVGCVSVSTPARGRAARLGLRLGSGSGLGWGQLTCARPRCTKPESTSERLRSFVTFGSEHTERPHGARHVAAVRAYDRIYLDVAGCG